MRAFDVKITSTRIAWLDDSANYRRFTVYIMKCKMQEKQTAIEGVL